MGDSSVQARVYDVALVKRLLTPIEIGVGAARHLAWYVTYRVTGEPR